MVSEKKEAPSGMALVVLGVISVMVTEPEESVYEPGRHRAVTEKYRTGWDATFGRQEVGQA